MDGALQARPIVRGGMVIAVAMGVMNVTTYGFTILAARLLGPVEYGALAAVMGLLLVLNVLSLGLQATGARRVAAAPSDRERIERELLGTTYRAALALGGLALLAVPVVSAVLNLDSWWVAALIAVTIVPLTVMGGQAGVLQGERRWGPLAAIYLGVGLGRIAFGTLALLLRPDTFGAMVGVAVGAFAPAVVGAWALRRHPADSAEPPETPQPSGHVLRETIHNSHALLAFFALTNVDVIVARTVLDERQAGLYAGGLILAKAVLFLPQFVVVVAFPSMSSAESARRMNLMALGMVLGIGLTVVLGVLVLPQLAVIFIGGAAYADLAGRLWAFALLGTLLAMIQLLIYNVLARQRQHAVYVVWATLLALVVAAPFLASASMLLGVVLAADAVLFGVLLAWAGTRRRVPAG
jgi:O-antigen/teichoic acid export membrane protein